MCAGRVAIEKHSLTLGPRTGIHIERMACVLIKRMVCGAHGTGKGRRLTRNSSDFMASVWKVEHAGGGPFWAGAAGRQCRQCAGAGRHQLRLGNRSLGRLLQTFFRIRTLIMTSKAREHSTASLAAAARTTSLAGHALRSTWARDSQQLHDDPARRPTRSLVASQWDAGKGRRKESTPLPPVSTPWREFEQ